ncbi:hypothetical protein E2C01_072846 [Portunus trituberculatus]|uniref:Uncharacterized protein n=1 Tax=Portunus trituberculatus TaxID=210409 RepID=A0A5B7I3N1_PORTR|nr:hypothetical protein [Portunus trituberculatus]
MEARSQSLVNSFWTRKLARSHFKTPLKVQQEVTAEQNQVTARQEVTRQPAQHSEVTAGSMEVKVT